MADSEQTEKQYHAASSVDLLSALSALDIEFLTVSDQRVLIIYARSILNVDVNTGDIQSADALEVTVLDHDPSGGINHPHGLITRVIDQIDETAGSDLSPVS
ncbi:hypothetical protein [Natrialba sp. SSL1]|uniref:hypothetical protein n=1 Tax=Natrialba sp. SSL1 TaxID=1869245 RepID=UPI0008F8EC74|nr:hypothetical protein [Natrialba sp. SSL1]OIB56204.1 hypothetical protein BBD46_19580 [Natrialba sp. SSL1]